MDEEREQEDLYLVAKERIDQLCRMDRTGSQNEELNDLWDFARDHERVINRRFEQITKEVGLKVFSGPTPKNAWRAIPTTVDGKPSKFG